MERFPLDDGQGSFAWIADPAEAIERSSSAIAVEGGCIVVDPVDTPDLDGALSELGAVIGVATLLDRHQRDAEAVAARHQAPRLLPISLGGGGVAVDGVEERPVVRGRVWKEALLWLPDRRLLVCAETLGTSAHFLAREGDRLGVHPLARLFRVRRAFEGLAPETIAVGHGPPLVGGAAAALASALRGQRRDLLRAWARAVRLMARAG